MGNNIYAGFWRRALAFAVDFALIAVVYFILAFILRLFLGGETALLQGAALWAVLSFYWVILESSSLQATIGKKILGIKVTDMEGKKISFLRSLARVWGKIISKLALFLGFFMASFTERKQALHDKMAGCLVVKKDAAFAAPAPVVKKFVLGLTATSVFYIFAIVVFASTVKFAIGFAASTSETLRTVSVKEHFDLIEKVPEEPVITTKKADLSKLSFDTLDGLKITPPSKITFDGRQFNGGLFTSSGAGGQRTMSFEYTYYFIPEGEDVDKYSSRLTFVSKLPSSIDAKETVSNTLASLGAMCKTNKVMRYNSKEASAAIGEIVCNGNQDEAMPQANIYTVVKCKPDVAHADVINCLSYSQNLSAAGRFPMSLDRKSIQERLTARAWIKQIDQMFFFTTKESKK